MRTRAVVLAGLLLTAKLAAAQSLEVGAGIARGCIGDSSGFCGDQMGAMPAVHASLWLDDRLEIGLRLARLALPNLYYSVPRDDRFNAAADPAARQIPRLDIASEYRSRRLQDFELIYHFMRGRAVRPMLGFGIGGRTERFQQTCLPAGCEHLMAILSEPIGRFSATSRNIPVIAGLSARVHEHLQLRGGVRFDNFAGEEASTTEMFVAAGFRFGR